ncbi:hypothetical protein W5Q_04448 [Candida albicans SC5314]|nr:hypothetical protein W5Q_04448 [Candida albicans SC5314]
METTQEATVSLRSMKHFCCCVLNLVFMQHKRCSKPSTCNQILSCCCCTRVSYQLLSQIQCHLIVDSFNNENKESEGVWGWLLQCLLLLFTKVNLRSCDQLLVCALVTRE